VVKQVGQFILFFPLKQNQVEEMANKKARAIE